MSDNVRDEAVEYDSFGPVSDEEAAALAERLDTAAEDEALGTVTTDESATPVVTETDEERIKREQREENERKYREEAAAREALMVPFVKSLGLLINQNLGKLSYKGKKLSGAWVGEKGHLVITTASGDYIQVSPYANNFYMWHVGPAILEHARMLGHDPSEFAHTYDIGKVSACSKCTAMARIAEDANGVEEVIAPAYMASCPGKR